MADRAGAHGKAIGIGLFRRIVSALVVADNTANEKDFAQVGHGLNVGDWAEFTTGDWAGAQADASTTLASGLVTEVADVNNLKVYALGGDFVTVTGHGAGVAGDLLYLSQGTPGAAQTSAPASGIIQMLALVIDANTLLVQSWAASA